MIKHVNIRTDIVDVNITKKNKKYFKFTSNSGYGRNCEGRLLIDENSEELQLGQQRLTVDVISNQTKYGIDDIYKVHIDTSADDIYESRRFVTIGSGFFSRSLADECIKLGGEWDDKHGVWIFSDIVEAEVEALDIIYNSDAILCEIKFIEDIYTDKEAYFFRGIKIAAASGRDSGAIIGKNIAMISGSMTSSGSVKNWSTLIEEGTIIRFKIPNLLLSDEEKEHLKSDGFIEIGDE